MYLLEHFSRHQKAVLLLFVFSRINKPHFSNVYVFLSHYDGTSKQVLVPIRGKKKYQHFLSFIIHLNQRKSPSATLVSQEIETDFFVIIFSRSRGSFLKPRKLLNVAEVRVVFRVSS